MAKHHNTQKILLPYRFCGDSHHAFAFPFVLIFLPLRLSYKESSTSNQAFSIVFTPPSVPLVGDRNLRRKDVTALLGAQNRYAIRLAGHQSPRHVLRDGTAWGINNDGKTISQLQRRHCSIPSLLKSFVVSLL